jgi:hypothetical protein
MRGRQLVRLIPILIYLCAQLVSETYAQTQTRQSPVATSRPKAQSANYFAIMGAIRQQGVYELPNRFASLVEFVRRAGGLTSNATGNIRIVRNGRAGLQTFYSDRNTMTLIPGDVVIVDSRRFAGRAGAGSRFTNQRTAPVLVAVAFVNLVDRPIVVTIPTERATVERIVKDLGQHPDIAKRVQVVGPRTSRKNNDLQSQVMQSGSVLVFPSSLIDTYALPVLPNVIPIAARLDIRIFKDCWMNVCRLSSGHWTLWGQSKWSMRTRRLHVAV